MKDNMTKKELRAQYNAREVTGGVYVIRNTGSNKLLFATSSDLKGSRNRFEFSQKTESCVDMKLQSDWSRDGGGQFVFEVLEELKKGETQSAEEFKADIEVLGKMWLEKLSDREFY